MNIRYYTDLVRQVYCYRPKSKAKVPRSKTLHKNAGGGGTTEPAPKKTALSRLRRLLPRGHVLGLWIFLRQNRPHRDELRRDGPLPLPLLRARSSALPAHTPPHLNRREWTILLVASVLGVPLQFLFQFHGLALTTVSHAALMVGTMPVILAVGATIFAHERLHKLGWIALIVSTMGAAPHRPKRNG